jgi:hypothetical protein
MKIAKTLSPLALVFLQACASTAYIQREPGSCMETTNTSLFNGAITANNTNWNENCAQAQAAVIFAKMQTADGRPDVAGQAVAIQMYLNSNARVQESFDRLLGEEGMTFDELVQRVRTNNGPVCRANGNGQFICS